MELFVTTCSADMGSTPIASTIRRRFPKQKVYSEQTHTTLMNKPAKKKQYGQHFLRSFEPIQCMLNNVKVTRETSVVEIGCGEGVLTKAILNQTPCRALHVFEIDSEWADHTRTNITDERLHITVTDVLKAKFENTLEPLAPCVLMANLPYQITFPLFERIAAAPQVFTHGVVMVQEEAAQRMVSTSGRRYGSISLLLQYSLQFTLLDQVPASMFSPPPKVMSRLVHFAPRPEVQKIEDATTFWKFTRSCFVSPRQNLRNNLKRTHYDWRTLSEETLKLRAQQLELSQFIAIWEQIKKS